MPTVWDETKVIEGKIGEFATIARKTGSDWVLGSLTGNAGRTVQLSLNFLDESASYEAVIYSHEPDSESTTKVKIETRKVNAGSVLEFEVAENSGLAVHFRKV